MKTTHAISYWCIMIGCAVASAFARQGQEISPSGEYFQNRATALAKQNVSQIDILYFPTNAMTRTRISRSDLEKNFRYKLVIRDIPGSKRAEDLRRILKGTHVAKVHQDADLRWGCIFYGESGKRVGEVFLDASGLNGY